MAKPSTGPDKAGQPTQEQIAERARKLWMERGSPGGRDLEHWFEAERQLRDEAGRRGPKKADDPFKAEKRLDGLIEQKPSPASRTPSGEQL